MPHVDGCPLARPDLFDDKDEPPECMCDYVTVAEVYEECMSAAPEPEDFPRVYSAAKLEAQYKPQECPDCGARFACRGLWQHKSGGHCPADRVA